MKILYLKGYRWLLSPNQQVRVYFFGYRQYEVLTKHVKSFLKNIKKKGCQCLGYSRCYYEAIRKFYKIQVLLGFSFF